MAGKKRLAIALAVLVVLAGSVQPLLNSGEPIRSPRDDYPVAPPGDSNDPP